MNEVSYNGIPVRLDASLPANTMKFGPFTIILNTLDIEVQGVPMSPECEALVNDIAAKAVEDLISLAGSCDYNTLQVAKVATHLTLQHCERVARTYFPKSSRPADISCSEAGHMIADSIVRQA